MTRLKAELPGEREHGGHVCGYPPPPGFAVRGIESESDRACRELAGGRRGAVGHRLDMSRDPFTNVRARTGLTTNAFLANLLVTFYPGLDAVSM